MLATQVQFWANQEQKRHNLVQEANQLRELDIAAQNAQSQERSSKASAKQADVAEMQANIGAVNALTQQQALEINKMQANAALQQAATARGNLELAQKYKPIEISISQQQADSAAQKAAASIQSAKAAQLQAESSAALRKTEEERNRAQTTNTELQNDFYAPIAGSKITSTIVDVVRGVSSLLPKKAK